METEPKFTKAKEKRVESSNLSHHTEELRGRMIPSLNTRFPSHLIDRDFQSDARRNPVLMVGESSSIIFSRIAPIHSHSGFGAQWMAYGIGVRYQKRKGKEPRWRMFQQPWKTRRTWLLNTHSNRKVSDQESAEILVDVLMKKENLKNISSLIRKLREKSHLHNTKGQRDIHSGRDDK